MLRPIGRRAGRIIVLQRLVVVPPFVAEEASKSFEVGGACDQPVPVIVPYLVAEMTEECPVRLAHLMTAAFALRIVSFRKVDSDHAVGMAGHHRRT
jgi:hypothetical protein